MNVPADASWYLLILGNTVVVSSIKLLFSKMVSPKVSRMMALWRWKFRKDSDTLIGSSEVIDLYKTQVAIALLIEVRASIGHVKRC